MSSKTWEVMNDLEMVTSKICSAREIIDSLSDAIQKRDYEKAESLANAAYEFLGYYLEDFDVKFKKAWKETVVNQKQVDDGMRPWGHSDLEYLIANPQKPLSCDKDDKSPECQGAWNDFWEENYYPEEYYDKGSQLDTISRNDPTRLKYEAGWIYESPDQGKTVTKRKVGSMEKIVIKEDKVVKWQLPVEVDGISGEYYVQFPDDLMEAANIEENDLVEWVDRGDGSYLLKKVTRPLGLDEC